MQYRNKHPQRTDQAGVALIEALIGILIFAFGVLGLVGLQATATRAQTSSKFRADAANLASELLGLIQTDNIVNINQYADANCPNYARCNGWLTKVQAGLPAGAATITVTGSSVVTLTITWQQAKQEASNYTTSMSWQP